MTLYLLNYNNYYNRIVKRETTIADYVENAEVVEIVENVNFIRGNGVITSQIVNMVPAAAFPDYMVCVNEYSEIDSRWFITETTNLRQGQYRLSLLRDVVADWYDEVINAPCFVEKATLGVNDPGIFNNEDMTFNQIKTGETPIKDITKSAWYVGYLNREGAFSDPIVIPKSTAAIDNTYTTKANYPYFQYTKGGSGNFSLLEDITYYLYFRNHVGSTYKVGWDKNGNPKTPTYGESGEVIEGLSTTNISNVGFLSGQPFHTATEIGRGILEAVANSSADWTEYNDTQAFAKTAADLANLQKEVGKIYQLDGDYYQIALYTEEVARTNYAYTNTGPYATRYFDVAAASGELNTNDTKGNVCGFEANKIRYYVELVPYTVDNWSFSLQNRAKCEDSPWDMFCLPYHAVKHGTWTTSPEMTVRVRDAIINSFTEQQYQLYDVQLLPYCPLDDYLLEDQEISISKIPNTETITNYIRIGDEATNTLMVFCSRANFQKTIIPDKPLGVPSSAIEFKVANECDMYRLISPNYNGQFEFSLAKNGGISHYNLTLSCKPYTPYIKLAPAFRRLYGRDFGDARGLICGGDFSISRLNSAWETYEITNKNYQVMFDRQIQNMEVNNAIQRQMEMWGIGAGVASGAAAGYMAGSMAGGAYGAYGALIGGAISAAGGAADLYYNDKLRAEALDYTKDQFGYQLQNIQALPSSLTKVSVINADNKLFPILEYYTCSDTEKQALRDKVKYNGMTVMRIGTFAQFIRPNQPSYIKGSIIRLEDLGEDYLIATKIANELKQGVYI